MFCPCASQFGTGLRPSDISNFPGYFHNFATWLIKQVAFPVVTGLKATPWSAVRDRLGLPRTASGCPLVDAVTHLSGCRVRQCDVLLNAIMVSLHQSRVARCIACLIAQRCLIAQQDECVPDSRRNLGDSSEMCCSMLSWYIFEHRGVGGSLRRLSVLC